LSIKIKNIFSIGKRTKVNERTLAILKPDCLEKRLQGRIIQHILDSGFNIIGMQLLKLTKESAEKFYAVHIGKPFYESLVAYMTSGPVIPLALEKENAVDDFRKMIGATDPQKAEEGTIRKLYAESIERNIVHGSDSPENAVFEISHFFTPDELI
jgi:nucleoside-diphosphate kinase